MSNYISSLLSRSLMKTETIRPRLPSLFEPIVTPYISRSGKRWDSEEAEFNVDWNTEIKKPLNELKEEIYPASKFLEKRENQIKYSNPKEFQMGIEDVPGKSKQLQQETSTVESTRIKPAQVEISQSKFSHSEENPSKPEYQQRLSLFKSSGNLKEKEPLDLESNLKPIQNQTFYQNNSNGVGTSRNLPHFVMQNQTLDRNTVNKVENPQSISHFKRQNQTRDRNAATETDNPQNIPHLMRQDQTLGQSTSKGNNPKNSRQFISQYASILYRSDKNDLPNESNLAPTSTSIVPKLLENEAVTTSRPLKRAGSVIVPDSVWDVKTKAEVEQPVIRVNIGRIEVKAVTQPSLSQKRENKPQAPKLSLESYLNSRNGGKI